uniref:Uncharacterized protein n=1 Tax=Anopheles minimus TaxID=112268 RepID=A0A182W5K8_9DIPT
MDSKRIRLEDREYAYTARDRNNFLRCCKCRCYTPFLIYQSSEQAPDAQVKAAQHNLICVNCMTEDDTKDLQRAERILYDKEVLKLFEGHDYQNPFYVKYATQDRLIITGESHINPQYKEIARKPMP